MNSAKFRKLDYENEHDSAVLRYLICAALLDGYYFCPFPSATLSVGSDWRSSFRATLVRWGPTVVHTVLLSNLVHSAVGL
jgi:hypothetical protein